MVDFSSVPGEILGLIFKHICKNSIVDDLSFSEFAKEWRSIIMVSKEWKSIAGEKLSHLLPRTILLPLHGVKKSPLLSHLHGKLGFATDNGWLLIEEQYTCQMFLLNPLTKHRIRLPSLPRYVETTAITLKFKSTTDYQVAVCENIRKPMERSRIFACKAGDKKWTVEEATWAYAEDVAYYNQKLYVIYDSKNFHLYSEINATRKHKIYYESSDFIYEDDGPIRRSYLVETPQKELMKIIRYTKKNDRGGYGKTINFEVFKMNDKRIHENWLKEEEEVGDEVLNKVEDLGDNIVFLGANCNALRYILVMLVMLAMLPLCQ